MTRGRTSLGFMILVAAQASAGAVAPHDPPGEKDRFPCRRAQANLTAGDCANLDLGCGEVRLCCKRVEGDVTTLSAVENASKAELMRDVELPVGELTAFPLRGHLVWMQSSLPSPSDSALRTVVLAPKPCPANESEKISSLISLVESMTGAVFIRNGKEYSPAKAAEHMRSKYAWKKDEIATAEDFIDKVASRSSASDAEYEIRFGKAAKKSGPLLREMLRLMETACPTDSPHHEDKRKE